MKLSMKRGAESKLIQIFIQDASQTDGSGLTGLVYNTASLTAYYYRDTAASAVSISLADMTAGTWASGGFKEIDATNLPGWYQLGVPDAALVTAAESVGIMLKGAADMAPVNVEIQLDLGDVVWDEVLTGQTHNVPTSAGRRLRGIQEFQGYELGAIWIDTNNGVAGTTDYENGTVERPVDSIADALILAASLKITRFQVAPGSSITFAATMDDYLLEGEEWTLALGGRSCNLTVIKGATTVTGTATAASHLHLIDCELGDITIGASHVFGCGLDGDITLSAAGDYYFDACFHGAAGTAVPSLDFGAVGSTNLHMHHYAGGIEVKNIGDSGTDVMHLDGHGQLTINANCSGGTITVNGNFPVIDNASAVVTLTDTGRFSTDHTVDADAVAISGSTDAADRLEASAETIVVGAASAGTLSTTQMTTTLTEVTDDHYSGRIIIWTSGVLKDQGTDITDYVGATKMLSYTAVTEAPSAGDTFVVV